MEPLTLADRFRSGAPESAKTRSILTRRARRPSDTDKLTCDVMLLEEEAKMLRTLAYATLFSATLIGPGAYGADDAAAPKDQPPQAQAPSGVNFVTRQEKSHGVRRSSWESAFTAPTINRSERSTTWSWTTMARPKLWLSALADSSGSERRRSQCRSRRCNGARKAGRSPRAISRRLTLLLQPPGQAGSNRR